MIIDNFLATYDVLRQAAVNADYDGVTNPRDGVVYPEITDEIPAVVKDEIQLRLNECMGRKVDINVMFMRLTSKNTKSAPHSAHNDSVMGDYTLLLYLNNGPGGTSFVIHKETGMKGNPRTHKELAAWKRDTNIPDAWEIYEMVEMKQNRANIILASRMHRAEPVGGFGSDASDGRIVLTAFFT